MTAAIFNAYVQGQWLKQVVAASIVVVFVCLVCAPTAAAASSGAISQSYTTSTTNVTEGALLSLESSRSNVVEPANSTQNADRLIGVAADKPLIELSNDDKNSIQVVVSGTADALVSNINGAVLVGDKITASPVSGIGMKASGSTEIVGTVEESLSSVPRVTESFVAKDGSKITIKVGLVPVAIGVEYYSMTASSNSLSTVIPPFLQNLANSLVGKQVSPLRVLLGTLVIVLGFITATVMIYGSVRSGLISIGRNPLAARSLEQGIVSVIIAAIGVLVVTIAAVFVVLHG